MNEILLSLKDKKILILGFGREGQSTYKFLRKYFPGQKLDIADQKEFSRWDLSAKKLIKGDWFISINTGKAYLDNLFRYDIIFKSPGIPGKILEIKRARKGGVVVTSQTKLFFGLCKGTIVGVTGTKGKSTTTTLIYQIVKNSGLKVVILGNIGKPCLDYLGKSFGAGQIFAFELSSHQLSDLTKSPHVAVFLNIFKEHMDYYESFGQYFEAKRNITRFQSEKDYLVYNCSDVFTRKAARETNSKVFGFSIRRLKDSSCFLENGSLVVKMDRDRRRLIGVKVVPLVGEHNLNNVMAAVLASKVLGIPDRVIRETIKTFKPLEHRLQNVGTYKSITFIDDSLATVPEATIAAIKAFSGSVGTLILGGNDRDQDFKELAKVILKEKVANLILFPTTGGRIWRAVRKISTREYLPKVIFVSNMEDAIKFCFKNTPKRTVCLLSTASPSFSVFRDYQEKSKLFKKYIKIYAEVK